MKRTLKVKDAEKLVNRLGAVLGSEEDNTSAQELVDEIIVLLPHEMRDAIKAVACGNNLEEAAKRFFACLFNELGVELSFLSISHRGQDLNNEVISAFTDPVVKAYISNYITKHLADEYVTANETNDYDYVCGLMTDDEDFLGELLEIFEAKGKYPLLTEVVDCSLDEEFSLKMFIDTGNGYR